MVRRILGFLLCLLVITAATSDFYNLADKNTLPLELQFEASYVALDSPDDFGDTPYPAGIVNGPARSNSVIKLLLSASVRKFRFVPRATPSFERPIHSRLTSQDLFRLEKVFRI